jgi:hypothetical protein
MPFFKKKKMLEWPFPLCVFVVPAMHVFPLVFRVGRSVYVSSRLCASIKAVGDRLQLTCNQRRLVSISFYPPHTDVSTFCLCRSVQSIHLEIIFFFKQNTTTEVEQNGSTVHKIVLCQLTDNRSKLCVGRSPLRVSLSHRDVRLGPKSCVFFFVFAAARQMFVCVLGGCTAV